MSLPPYFFVFDVESVGLFGHAFAVGYTVLDQSGVEKDAACLCCPIKTQEADNQDLEWVLENVPPLEITHSNASEMRTDFWKAWKYWNGYGAVMVADCAYPVENLFILDCIMEDESRKQNAPYPLHDVASVLLAKWIDPTQDFKRLPEEKPRHNPLADARQSGRILIENLFPDANNYQPKSPEVRNVQQSLFDPEEADEKYEQSMQELQDMLREWDPNRE